MCIRDRIQTILVAQVVQCILILVMAGTDGLDVVLLHGDDIPKQFLMGVYAHSTTRNGAELMTVGTLEPVSYTHLDVYKRQLK